MKGWHEAKIASVLLKPLQRFSSGGMDSGDKAFCENLFSVIAKFGLKCHDFKVALQVCLALITLPLQGHYRTG